MQILKIALYGVLAIILYKLMNTKVVISSAKVNPQNGGSVPFPTQSVVDYVKPLQNLQIPIVQSETVQPEYTSPVSTDINLLVTPITTD